MILGTLTPGIWCATAVRIISRLWAGNNNREKIVSWIWAGGFPNDIPFGRFSGPPGACSARPLENTCFKRGLKTYVITRGSRRASIWYRFYQTWIFTWRCMAKKRLELMWPYFHRKNECFSKLIYARPDGFHKNIMRDQMISFLRDCSLLRFVY